MKRTLTVVACMLLVAPAVFAEMTIEDIRTKPRAEVEAQLPFQHPASYYVYAQRLFLQNRKDDAVFWFYAGQLRYRFHLSANPNLPRGGDEALMASLNSVIGQPINEYAGGDPQMWIAQIDRALKWDAVTKNEFTSKDKFNAQWEEVRGGLLKMRTYIVENPELIKQQREKAGLPNR
jgi:hypothetical protein